MASTDAYVTTKVPSHLPYLNQFCNVAITMLYVIIIYFTSQLIYCSLFVKQSMMVRSLSSSIMIFLVIRQLGALTSLPYSLYSAIKWTPKVHQCQSLSCVLRKYNLAVPLNGKLVIGFLNICASGLLMYAIRSTKTIHKLKNKVVKMTMFLEITLDMTPVFVNQICVMAGVPVGLYVGQLDTFMTMANVAICSVYYSKILIKRGNGCCVPSKKIVINVTLFNTASLHTRRSVPITSTKVTMITEILLDVMPTFLNQLFFMITEDSLGSYAGQLPTCLSMLNVAICSIHYSRILIRRQDTCCSSSYRVQTVNAWSS
ncbi:hypothetical protein DdX_17248 [Ditylenchus destructor]|uniref:Uncharacterized protein n=1 Tax=Ditylenchus destructor TaxID=166010 RepID=A0AAD4MM11_9BILA|nr:hypothetical protein DdX_17248 [Ditylenchus destructor]